MKTSSALSEKARRRFAASASFLFAMLLSTNAALAADPVIGAACSGTISAGPLAASGNNVVCSSSLWQYPAYQFGASSATCNSNSYGALQWTGTVFQGCTSAGWTSFNTGTITIGASLTATNPQIASDATSGLYTPLGSTVSIVTGGVERLRVSSSGYVSIGTTSSNSLLQIGGGAVSAASWTTQGLNLYIPGTTLTDTSGSGTIANRVGASLGYPTFAATGTETISNAATFYISGSPAAGTNVTITNSLALDVGSGTSYFGGNVGIGAVSPTSLLQTNDTAAKTAAYTGVLHGVYNTSSTTTINKVGMDIESTGAWTGTSAVNTGLVVNATGGTTNYAATFSGGNVGIGTTAPAGALQVYGPSSTYLRTYLSSQSGQNSYLELGVPTQPAELEGASNGSFQLNIFGGASGVFQMLASGAVANTLVLNAGNVGIGTATPQSPLELYSGSWIGDISSTAGSTFSYGTFGIGFNVVRNASTTTWYTSTDTAHNGGGFVDADIGGDLRFFNVISTGGTAQSLTDAQMLADEHMVITSAGNVGIGTTTVGQKLVIAGNADVTGGNGYLSEIANDTSTGTTANSLAKLTTVGSAIIGTTGDTDGMVGVVVGSAGKTGSAQIAIGGQASCTFDNVTTAGDYVTISSSTAGDCHDAGTTRSTSSETIGRVLATNASIGTNIIAVGLTPTASADGGVSGSGTTNYVARWTPNGTTLGTGVIYDNGTQVGIGTISPSDVLDVNGSLTLEGTNPSISVRGGNVNSNVNIDFPQNSTTNAQVRFFRNTNTSGGTVNLAIYKPDGTGANMNTVLSANGASSYINAVGGNVGIGTSNPQSTLSVSGGAAIGTTYAGTNAAGSNNLIVQGAVGIGTTSTANLLTLYGAGTPTIQVTNSSGGYLQLASASSVNSLGGYSTTGNTAYMDVFASPADGTSAAYIRLFRTTNTTGTVGMYIEQGNNTATANSFLSGNGNSYLNAVAGNVGIGTASPNALLNVNGPSYADPSSSTTAVNFGATFNAIAAGNSTNSSALVVSPSIGAANTQNWTSTLALVGVRSLPTIASGATGTIGTVIGYQEAFTHASANTLTNHIGLRTGNPTVSGGGTITNSAGIVIDSQSVATNNTFLLLGQLSVPTGNYGIYDASTNNNYFGGNVGIGTTSPGAITHIFGTTEQLRLGYDATHYTSFVQRTNGDITIQPSGGAVYLGPSYASTNSFYVNSDGHITQNSSANSVFSGAGFVGIGTTGPLAALDVVGSIYSRSVNAAAATTINWASGNTQYTTASCGAFSFSGMKDGGSYTLLVEGTTSGTCSFTNSDSPTLSFRLPSNHGATTAGTMTLYHFIRVGTYVLATWMPGYSP